MAAADLFSCTGATAALAGAKESWTPTIERLIEATDAKHALLVVCDRAGHGGTRTVGVHMDDSALERFGTPEFASWVQPYRRALSPGKVAIWSQLICDQQFERSPLYNDVVRPAGGFYAVAVEEMVSSFSYFLAFCRPREAGDYSPRDAARLQAQLPCITAALEVSYRLGAVESGYQQLLHLLDRIDAGIMLVDSSGGMIFANSAAETLFGADGLALDASGIATTDRHATRALKRLIAESGAGLLDIYRGEHRAPLRLFVAPFHGEAATGPASGTAEGCPAAILLASDPERQRQAAKQRLLQQQFGLTAAETDLALAILAGETIQQYAQRLGRSHDTARTHLKAVFLKTGTRRQAELVRELATACLLSR